MGFIIKIVGASVIALGLGIASALWAIDEFALTDSVRNGAWRALGAADAAHPYARAYRARHGLYALDTGETLAFTAATDDSGAPLDGSCTYRITGADLPADWWSVTVYGADLFLIDNAAKKFSVRGTKAAEAGGAFQFSAGPDAKRAALPVAPGAPFTLTLRLFGPEASAAKNPASFLAPSIVKEACG